MPRSKGRILRDLITEVRNGRLKELDANDFGFDSTTIIHEDASYFKLMHSIYEVVEKQSEDFGGKIESVRFLIVYTEHNGNFVWAMDDLKKIWHYNEKEDETITVH